MFAGIILSIASTNLVDADPISSIHMPLKGAMRSVAVISSSSLLFPFYLQTICLFIWFISENDGRAMLPLCTKMKR